MQSLLTLTLIVTLAFGVGNWYVKNADVCPVPIYYKLGEVDERFGITNAEAIEILSEAEAVWENSINRDLFIYDDSSDFAVNFIYDERQQMASTEEAWRLRLDGEEKASKDLIDKVKVIAEEYQKLQVAYEEKRVQYEERLSAYNDRVEEANKNGGATPDIFAELKAEQKVLSSLLNSLVSQEKQLNQQADSVNELGEQGNLLVEKYNAEVLKYNEVYGAREQYTQGDFQRDRINIYKFSDKTELTKVIVHEFGHSLGVGHVEGEVSMMYYLMAEQPDKIVLSEEDKQALITTCGDGTGFANEARRIIRTVLSYL